MNETPQGVMGTATTTSEPLMQLSTGTEQPTTDTWTVRLVVLALALISVAVVIGSVVLATSDRQLPDSIQTLGAGCVGALGAMLASTRSVFQAKAPKG